MFASYPGWARILGLSAPRHRKVLWGRGPPSRGRQRSWQGGGSCLALHRITLRQCPVDSGRIALDPEKP
ncbi:hypothetical protein DF051_09310 [Burkholderia contaminans]|uniref:Uncharacterized protein n=1 Tax=Burkholderia contaminans TaxID=488447 RepID=A0A3N8Q579_9BURK|nr:hypothetical protein DF051_09310 [Burkholderia contaminans]